jgi:hypothetical protein
MAHIAQSLPGRGVGHEFTIEPSRRERASLMRRLVHAECEIGVS